MDDQNLLMQFLNSMNGVRWLILGFALLVAEVATGTTYILWVAFSALITGIVTFILPFGWEMQFLLFVLVSIALLYVGQVYVRPKFKGGEPSDLNERARALEGTEVKAASDFETGIGRVHVGDTQWRARTKSGANVKAGTVLKVLNVDGTTLVVEPV